MREMKEHDLLELQQSPELAFLADLPAYDVYSVRYNLRCLMNVSAFEGKGVYPECRTALTVTELFDEDEAELKHRACLVLTEGPKPIDRSVMCERKFDIAVDVLVESIVKDEAVREDILPGKVQEFDVKEFMCTHEEWLRKWADLKRDAPVEYDLFGDSDEVNE
ncbi:hypothetical protein HDU98_006521 [Podochytrium sp. JEL0797]|nr:hypothetical protein HDU98_006521 [Podochytrium sp. JEL0797]